MIRVGPAHYVAEGYVNTRKRAQIKSVTIDGEDVPIEDAVIDLTTRKFIKKRKRG